MVILTNNIETLSNSVVQYSNSLFVSQVQYSNAIAEENYYNDSEFSNYLYVTNLDMAKEWGLSGLSRGHPQSSERRKHAVGSRHQGDS